MSNALKILAPVLLLAGCSSQNSHNESLKDTGSKNATVANEIAAAPKIKRISRAEALRRCQQENSGKPTSEVEACVNKVVIDGDWGVPPDANSISNTQ